MDGPMKDDMKSRVEARLAALDINPFHAAKSAGLERSFINDILIDRKKSVRGENLDRLAVALDCDPEYLTGHQATPRRLAADPAQGIFVVGVCETGVWRTGPAADIQSQGRNLPIGRNPMHPDAAMLAFDVRGDGAEAAGIHDGEIVVAVEFGAWKRRFRDLRDQTLCVVRRTRKAFDGVEVSIRRAVVTATGVHFVAPSASAYPVIEPASAGEVVEVLGVIEQAVRLFL